MNTQSHRRLEALWQEHWTAFPMERLCHFLRGSRSAASVVFIYLAFHAGSLRTSCHPMVISSPAGPQVAKLTLPLFARPACSILALPPSVEGTLILLWERTTESRGAKSHLAGVTHPGYIQLLAPETGCLVSGRVLMMTLFQVSTCVFLIWSVQRACWEGISNSRALPCFQFFLHW